MSAKTSPIPVTLLTGFLGSGKTTLLNHLVRQPELADALVIINEFGETALDHLLVAHSTENLVTQMSSGCLCCTLRGDLVKTLRDITWRFARNGQRQFRRVLVETTGLADPAPIVHTLMTHPQVAPQYRLDGIVATIDMATAADSLDHHREAVKQAAMADALLLTKSDLASDEKRRALIDRLERINPAAPRWELRNGVIAPERILGLGLAPTHGKPPEIGRWLKEESYTLAPSQHRRALGHGHDYPVGEQRQDPANRHDDHIRAFCFSVDEPIREEALSTWLDVLTGFIGSDILRVKGILNIEGRDTPIVLHGVQHIFHPLVALPAWPDQDRRSRLVFITQNVEREVIEATFHAFHRGRSPAGNSKR